MKPTVPFSHAILGCAGEVWDMAGENPAAAGTKKLSKAMGCASAGRRAGGADTRLAW